MITTFAKPHAQAFSPEEKKRYVVECRGTPKRNIWRYDVDNGTVGARNKLIDAADQDALDGLKMDLDGVTTFNLQVKAIMLLDIPPAIKSYDDP